MSASSSPPTTVLGGAKKSLTEEPSRRNSGCTHTPKSTSCDEARRRLQPGHDDAVARAREHRRADDDDVAAVGREGGADLVGDALEVARGERSVRAPTACRRRRTPGRSHRTASATDVVARSRPAATPSATRSPMRSSSTGLCPPLTMSTLASLTSTPTTSWPQLGKARRRHDSDIAQPEDSDPHLRHPTDGSGRRTVSGGSCAAPHAGHIHRFLSHRTRGPIRRRRDDEVVEVHVLLGRRGRTGPP